MYKNNPWVNIIIMPQTRGDEAIKYLTKMKSERGQAWLNEQARKKREGRAVLRAERDESKQEEEKKQPTHSEEYKNDLKYIIDTLRKELDKPELTIPEVKVII